MFDAYCGLERLRYLWCYNVELSFGFWCVLVLWCWVVDGFGVSFCGFGFGAFDFWCVGAFGIIYDFCFVG